MRGRRRANFLFWSNRNPRPGPKGSCNKVIQLSDFHQICILVFFFFFLNMSKCNPLQHSKKKLIQKLYAKQSNLSIPRKDLYASCAISFRSSEAALKNRKKQHPQNVSNVNQKVHKSQYYHCMLENTKEQDAKLSPASPAEQMAGHQHPNALWFAAGMDFEASSCRLGFGATISTWPSLSNFLGLLPCTKPVKTPAQLFKYLTSELLDIIHSSEAHSNQISGQVLL